MTNPKTRKQEVIDALPSDATTARAKTGISRACFAAWIRLLRSEPIDSPTHVYVKRWRRTKGGSSPIYAVGAFADAPKPAPRGGAEYNRRHYVRTVRPLQLEITAARRAARDNVKKLAKIPQTWASALIGLAT